MFVMERWFLVWASIPMLLSDFIDSEGRLDHNGSRFEKSFMPLARAIITMISELFTEIVSNVYNSYH